MSLPNRPLSKGHYIRKVGDAHVHPYKPLDLNSNSMLFVQSDSSRTSQGDKKRKDDKISSFTTNDHHLRTSNKPNKTSNGLNKISSLRDKPSQTSERKFNFKPVNEKHQRKRFNIHQNHGEILNHKTTKKRLNYCRICTPCCCAMLFIFLGLLLAIIIGAIFIAITLTNKTSTTTITKITSITTYTTTTTSSVTSTTSSVSSTTSTTITSTSTTTTTTARMCLFSCLNKTWISSTDLLAKWTFDGTFLDETNTYNALVGTAPSFVTNGYVNQAAQFNPATFTYLYTPYIPLINVSFTVEVWLYPTGFPNAFDHSILGLCTNPSNNQCLHLTIRNFAGVYHLYMSFEGDNCASSITISLNQWIHAAFTFDLTTHSMSIYQDGILGRNCISGQPPRAAATNVFIGYVPGLVATYGANVFQGYLDQLTIFNRVKSSCEILDDATLSTYYSFNPNILNTIVDDGPNSLSSISQNVSSISSGHRSDAISFNHNTSYFQINGLTGFGIVNKSFSISLWIRPVTLSGTLVFAENTGVLVWCMSVLGFTTNGSLAAQVWITNARAIFGPALSTSSVWHHIVQTWSPTNGLRLFINNYLVAEDLLARPYVGSTLSNNIKLGNRPINACSSGAIAPPFAYNGDIDDFRVYSRELTLDDICALYHY